MSSTKSTWKECPLLRMPLALEGSYWSFRRFRDGSYWASLVTMLMGDCLGPLASGKFSAHLSGPVNVKMRSYSSPLYKDKVFTVTIMMF